MERGSEGGAVVAAPARGAAAGVAFRLEAYDEVESTNEVVKRALEAGEPEGLAVSALAQTAGYGRQGRSWSSPKGGMYLSLLLRPDVALAQLPTLSLVVAMAVRRALAGLADEAGAASRVRIKWPNDVVLANPGFESGHADAPFRKLCGISLEGHAGGVCVGIGVNVVPPNAPDRVGGKNVPAYASELRAQRGSSSEELIACVRDAVLGAFSALYDTWLAEGFAPLLPEYEQHAELTGRFVSVQNIDGSLMAEGVVQSVDAWGRLLVLPEGARNPLALSSGEAHVSLSR